MVLWRALLPFYFFLILNIKIHSSPACLKKIYVLSKVFLYKYETVWKLSLAFSVASGALIWTLHLAIYFAMSAQAHLISSSNLWFITYFRSLAALWSWHSADDMLFFWWQYSQYTVALYTMNSSQFHSIYLANLHMNAGTKAAGVPTLQCVLSFSEIIVLWIL
jgi:hypothetical protein